MQIYSEITTETWRFSVIFWPILILFVLSDRAWCGLQNFYTELWNSLIMQIYANLFKIKEKCYFSVISWPILILFVLSDRAWCRASKLLHRIVKFLIMQIYSKSRKMLLLCQCLADFDPVCFIWIGLALGFKTSNRIVKFINANLCTFIQNQWKMPPLLYSEITTDLHLRRGHILRIA